MKKHRFAFIYKYIILAVALGCVLCFAFVFARYTTGSTTSVTVGIGDFLVDAKIIDPSAELAEGSSGDGSNDVTPEDTLNIDNDGIYVKITNDGSVAVNYTIDINDNFYFTAAYESKDLISIVDVTADETDSDGETSDVTSLVISSDSLTVCSGSNVVEGNSVMYVKLFIKFKSVDASDHTSEDANPLYPDTDNDTSKHPIQSSVFGESDLTFYFEQAGD